MNWQAIVSLVLMAAMAGLGALSTQYDGAEAPKWLPVVIAVIGAIGTAWRGIGVTGAAPPKAP